MAIMVYMALYMVMASGVVHISVRHLYGHTHLHVVVYSGAVHMVFRHPLVHVHIVSSNGDIIK